jgi:ketosteroid isomerase-like protein
MAHANVDLVRDGYATLGKGDFDALRDRFFAPDIIWHYAGRSQLGGHYHGIDQVLGWLGRLFELSEGTLRIDLHDVVGNDDHVIALTIVHAARNGKHLTDQGVQVFHIREGRVTEVWTLPGDQYTSDDFWR